MCLYGKARLTGRQTDMHTDRKIDR
jgi:hypothetical protein